jgi:hypothetical protein
MTTADACVALNGKSSDAYNDGETGKPQMAYLARCTPWLLRPSAVPTCLRKRMGSHHDRMRMMGERWLTSRLPAR